MNWCGEKSGYGDYDKSSAPYIMQTPKKQIIEQEIYEWKVLSVDNKSKEVIIIGIPTTDHQLINFAGAMGYNNGVCLLNDICAKLYSNTTLGVKARNINIEDIESKMNDKGRQAKEDYLTSNQGAREYTKGNAYYPEIYKYEKDSNIDGTENTSGISKSDDGTKTGAGIPMTYSATEDGYTSSNSITIKGTNYTALPQTEEYYDDKDFYSLIFNIETTYWLSSRGLQLDADRSYAFFRALQGNSKYNSR